MIDQVYDRVIAGSAAGSPPPQNRNLLVVGCGDIGTGLGVTMAALGWRVWGLRRDIAPLPASIAGIAADVASGAGLERLATLPPVQVVVALTPGESSDDAYRRVFVEGSRRVQAVLGDRAQAVLFLSSTRVYHQNDGGWVDEDSATEPAGFAGRRLLQAEAFWRDSGIPACNLRLGGLYGPGRDHLLRRLRSGKRHAEQPRRYSNRIHRDDAVGALAHLLRRNAEGRGMAPVYCVVDSDPAPLDQVERWVAERLGLCWSDMETFTASRGGNKRVSNAHLLASGYRLLYPGFREGFASMPELAGVCGDA